MGGSRNPGLPSGSPRIPKCKTFLSRCRANFITIPPIKVVTTLMRAFRAHGRGSALAKSSGSGGGLPLSRIPIIYEEPGFCIGPSRGVGDAITCRKPCEPSSTRAGNSSLSVRDSD